jgi:hypothetical protein
MVWANSDTSPAAVASRPMGDSDAACWTLGRDPILPTTLVAGGVVGTAPPWDDVVPLDQACLGLDVDTRATADAGPPSEYVAAGFEHVVARPEIGPSVVA